MAPRPDPDAPCPEESPLAPVLDRLAPFLAAQGGEEARFLDLVLSAPRDGVELAADPWTARAAEAWDALEIALAHLAAQGRLALNLHTIRAHLTLGLGVPPRPLGPAPLTVALVEDFEWRAMSRRGGLIELLLRAQAGELSPEAARALEAYVGHLPGFRLRAALRGEPQGDIALEVHGFHSGRLEAALDVLVEDCRPGALHPEALRAALHAALRPGQGAAP